MISDEILDILCESIERVPFYCSYPEEFNLIPATIYSKDGKVIKKPKGNWKQYQTQKYPREKLNENNPLCVVCGKISNNLLIIDFDKNKKESSKLSDNQIYENIIAKHPLLKKSGYAVKTMNGGFHFYFFLESVDVYKNLSEQEINIKAQKIGLKTNIKGIKEIDLRCEGNIVLTYPSKYKHKKYELWLKNETFRPLNISNKEFLDVLKSITITTTPKIEKETKLAIGKSSQVKVDNKFKKLRTPFKDILYGKIDIHKYKKKYGTTELIYWKFFFRELYHKCGLKPEEVFPLLRKNQPAFSLEETEKQLKYHPYTEPPLTAETMNEYFPDYKTKKTKKSKKSQKDSEKDSLSEYTYYELRDIIIRQNAKDNTNIITIRENDEICRHSNGVYVRKQKRFVETQISDLLEQFEITYSPYKTKTIISLIKTQTYHSIKEFDTNPELLNLKNGVLNLKTGEFRKHDPNDLFFIQIPVEYDPKAKCPKIEKFMNEVFKKEEINFIYEFIGLCLTPEMSFQKALMMYGDGNNGKTTFLNLVVNLIGENNKSSVALSQLNQSFEGAKLEGKLVNIVSDLDGSKMTIRFFKMYVGNEWSITINRKFKEPYDTNPTAKLLYSCNAIFPEIPKDTDKGFYRKWIVIECPNDFDERENLKILDLLTTNIELSGFLNKAIKGLFRLLERGKFETKYTNWVDVRNIWTEKINPFNKFIEEVGKRGKYVDAIHEPNNQFWETKEATLIKYNKYLEDKLKLPPIQKGILTRLINNHPNFFVISRSIKGKQQDVYAGFKLVNLQKRKINIQKSL